jgi:Fe-S-cluster containining protein
MQKTRRSPNLKIIEEPRGKDNKRQAIVTKPYEVEKINKYDSLRSETAKGLRYCHKRINANTSKSIENASFLYALVELMVEKGIIQIEELDARKKVIAERLVENFKDKGVGLMYQDPEIDKYNFDKVADVDCARHTPACNAICCKFPFALSRQDVEEGKIKWDFGRPYMIAHNEDGYCIHLDPEKMECSAREHRPIPCRGFDCRDNRSWKVWQDFERQITNEELVNALQQGDDTANNFRDEN